MSKAQAELTYHDVDKELAEVELAEFAQQAWHIVEPKRLYVHNWHVDAICEHLEAVTYGDIRNLLINMPPRHSKSLFVSVFWPIWSWISKPESRWIYASYAQSLSIRDSVKCRRIIQHPWFQARWGDRFKLTSDQNAKEKYDNDKTGYRIATSVSGAGTGEGGDFIVCDDPHKVGDAFSKTKRVAVLQWWDEEMSTRGNNPDTYAKVIVMQRVHERDLSGHVLKQGGYDHLCLPCEYDGVKRITGIGWEDPREDVGELLCPDRFNEAAVAEIKKRLGSRGSAGQLQQTPSPDQGNIVKRGWWQYYRSRPKFDWVLISWDFSFKDATTSDYVVGQVWGRRGADKYLLDQVRDIMGFTASVQAMIMLNLKWKKILKASNDKINENIVEEKANGAAIMDTLKKKISGLIPYNPTESKDARAAAVAPSIESGNVFLPDPETEGNEWVGDYIEEWAHFPGEFRDQVDSTAQALIRFGTHSQWMDLIDHTDEVNKITTAQEAVKEMFWPGRE